MTTTPKSDGWTLELLRERMRQAWRPPPTLSLSRWADTHGVLRNGPVRGRWHTLPYQREVMDALTDPAVELVVWKKCARVGATQIMGQFLGCIAHTDPSPVLMAQPTEIDAKNWSKEHIDEIFAETPVLRGMLPDAKKRLGDNTALFKQAPNGLIVHLVGAATPRTARRVDRKYILCDEINAYPWTTEEGDPVQLFINRSEYFDDRKIYLASTPTVKDMSKISEWFAKTDQRRFSINCLSCGYPQIMRFDQLKWERGQPATAAYECENCRHRMGHEYKAKLVEDGFWKPTATPLQEGYVGFHCNALISYSPNSTWGKIAERFLAVKSNQVELVTFINTVLGEDSEEEIVNKVEAEGLMKQREQYPTGFCPDGVLLLTGFIDVQINRLSFDIWGWGRGEEGWLIYQNEIMGDPTDEGVWKAAEVLINAEWDHESGGTLKLFRVGVDSGDGNTTNEVYGFCRDNRGKGVVATKGFNAAGRPVIGKPSKVDVNHRGRQIRNGVELYMIGTDTAKNTLYSRLRHKPGGPGTFHFGMAADREYFDQLTSERKTVRRVKGHARYEYIKDPKLRNEKLDCAVGSYAMLQLSYRWFPAGKMWDMLEADLMKKPLTPSQASGCIGSGKKPPSVADSTAEKKPAARKSRHDDDFLRMPDSWL